MEKTLVSDDDKKQIAFFLKVQAPVIMRSAAMSVGQSTNGFKRPKSDKFKSMFKGLFGKSRAIRMLQTYNDAITMQVVLMVAHQRIDELSKKDVYFLEDALNILEAADDALGTLKNQAYLPGASWNMGWLGNMLTFNRGIAVLDWASQLTTDESAALKKKIDADRIERRAIRMACGDTGFNFPPAPDFVSKADSEREAVAA